MLEPDVLRGTRPVLRGLRGSNASWLPAWVTGPKSEAEEIKHKLEGFLREQLKLELSQAKTLITHARTEQARFLGYEIQVLHNDNKQTNGRRSINAQIGFQVPKDVIDRKCQDYMEEEKPIHRPELLRDTVFTIISTYQAEYRGLVEYYRLAHDLNRKLQRLKWDMERSLIKTLAAKLHIPGKQVYRRYQTTLIVNGKPYKGLRNTIEREGKKPLVAEWGGIPLAWNIGATLDDQPKRVWSVTTELRRGSLQTSVSTVVLRKMRGTSCSRPERPPSKGRRPKPQWMVLMAARQRKTMVVCKTCHEDITFGRPMRRRETSTGFMHGEPVIKQWD